MGSDGHLEKGLRRCRCARLENAWRNFHRGPLPLDRAESSGTYGPGNFNVFQHPRSQCCGTAATIRVPAFGQTLRGAGFLESDPECSCRGGARIPETITIKTLQPSGVREKRAPIVFEVLLAIGETPGNCYSGYVIQLIGGWGEAIWLPDCRNPGWHLSAALRQSSPPSKAITPLRPLRLPPRHPRARALNSSARRTKFSRR